MAQRHLLISYIRIDKTSHNKLAGKQVRQKLDTEKEEQYKHAWFLKSKDSKRLDLVTLEQTYVLDYLGNFIRGLFFPNGFTFSNCEVQSTSSPLQLLLCLNNNINHVFKTA